MENKILFDEIEKNKIAAIKNPNYVNLMKIAIDFSDALIIGSETISKELQDCLNKCKKPVLGFQPKDSFIEKTSQKLMSKKRGVLIQKFVKISSNVKINNGVIFGSDGYNYKIKVKVILGDNPFYDMNLYSKLS